MVWEVISFCFRPYKFNLFNTGSLLIDGELNKILGKPPTEETNLGQIGNYPECDSIRRFKPYNLIQDSLKLAFKPYF